MRNFSKLTLLSLILLLGVSACNTIQGAGKDVKAAADAVEDSARNAKNY